MTGAAAPSRRNARLAVVAFAVLSAVAARVLSRVLLADVAHAMDEIAYLFEAKLFASGHIESAVVFPRAAFNMWFVDDRAARFSIFPPGWPAVLAMGVAVGAARWVNPLLHLATVVVVGETGERAGGPRAAVFAALVYAVCPQTVVLAASLMSHTLVALSASVVALALATLLCDGRRAARGIVAAAGAAVGVALATRPLCGIAIGLPFVVGAVLARRAVVAILPTLPPLGGLAAFDRALTGSISRFPQSAYFDEHIEPANVPFFAYRKGCNALGFGTGCDYTVRGASHTLLSALSDIGDNLRAWAILALAPVVVGAVALALARRGDRRKAAWLLAPTVLVIALYALYWQAGVCFGARFYHAALPGLAVAVALGVRSLGPRIRTSLVGAALVLALVGYVVAGREIGSWSYWGTDDRFAALRQTWHDGRGVVMVAFGPDDVKNPRLVATGAQAAGGTWLLGIRALAALGENTPEVDDGEIVFAKFHPALVADLAARFPDRALWLYTAYADRTADVLERWTPSRFAGHTYRRPADNFDGFRVAAPLALPDPIFREPTDEGWPP